MDDSEGQRTAGGGGGKNASPGAERVDAERKLTPAEPGKRRTQLPSEPTPTGTFQSASRPSLEPAKPAAVDDARRPSVLDVLSQSRTTVFEVGKVAHRLSLVALGLADARRAVRQVILSFVFGLTLALGVSLVFAGGTLRLVLGVLAGTCVTALGVFAVLRGVSKLAERYGARSLPGSPWLWVSGVVTVAVAGTLAVTLSIWEVTKVASAMRKSDVPKSNIAAASAAPTHGGRADANMKRDVHIGLERGVLYAPPSFQSADGRFDLVVHYHGNVALIEQSVARAKLNALVAIVNIGDGAGIYSKALRNPSAFDRMLSIIETRAQRQLKLEKPQIARIALSAWSAGFGSVNQILNSRSRLDRVDAVLLLDAPHAKYAPFNEPEVYRPSLKNYLTFAERAVSGQKLMAITHSAIQTEGYPSTTRTIDALLEELGLEREAVSPQSASPPPVDISVAKRAFPSGERNWLKVVSQVQRDKFYVYGCTGQAKGDHIAHLAQMSVTVLPLLRERWQRPPP